MTETALVSEREGKIYSSPRDQWLRVLWQTMKDINPEPYVKQGDIIPTAISQLQKDLSLCKIPKVGSTEVDPGELKRCSEAYYDALEDRDEKYMLVRDNADQYLAWWNDLNAGSVKKDNVGYLAPVIKEEVGKSDSISPFEKNLLETALPWNSPCPDLREQSEAEIKSRKFKPQSMINCQRGVEELDEQRAAFNLKLQTFSYWLNQFYLLGYIDEGKYDEMTLKQAQALAADILGPLAQDLTKYANVMKQAELEERKRAEVQQNRLKLLAEQSALRKELEKKRWQVHLERLAYAKKFMDKKYADPKFRRRDAAKTTATIIRRYLRDTYPIAPYTDPKSSEPSYDMERFAELLNAVQVSTEDMGKIYNTSPGDTPLNRYIRDWYRIDY